MNPSILLRQHDSHIASGPNANHTDDNDSGPSGRVDSALRAIRFRVQCRLASAVSAYCLLRKVSQGTISFDVPKGHRADASSIYSRAHHLSSYERHLAAAGRTQVSAFSFSHGNSIQVLIRIKANKRRRFTLGFFKFVKNVLILVREQKKNHFFVVEWCGLYFKVEA